MKGGVVLALGALVAFLLSPAAVNLGVRPMVAIEIRSLATEIVDRYFPAVDIVMLQAIAEIESGGNTRAFRNEPGIGDASAGLMQTLLGTAQWMWDTGFTQIGDRPDNFEMFFEPRVSMFYAAAYVNMLRTWSGRTRSEEFIIRAYNGGPGNAEGAATALYWDRYQAAKSRLEG